VNPLRMLGLGQTDVSPVPPGQVPVVAAVMAGATVALAVYAFKGPLWASILTGSAAALVTKVAIDQAGKSA
jgi:hypothetical protein